MSTNGQPPEVADAAISEALRGGKAERIREAIVELNGFDGTPEEVMSLLRHQRVAERTGLDPYTLSRLGDLGTVRLLASIPSEVKAAIQAGLTESSIEKRLGEAIEAVVEAQALLKAQADKSDPVDPAVIAAAVVAAFQAPAEEALTWPWLTKIVAGVRGRWPGAATAAARWCSLRWPVWLASAMGAVVVMATVSVVSAGAQWQRDYAGRGVLATSAGAVAVRLAEANPELVDEIRACTHSVAAGGRSVLSGCTFWAPASSARAASAAPAWWTPLEVVVDRWDPVGLALALLVTIAMIGWLAWIKRGPPLRRVRPKI